MKYTFVIAALAACGANAKLFGSTTTNYTED